MSQRLRKDRVWNVDSFPRNRYLSSSFEVIIFTHILYNTRPFEFNDTVVASNSVAFDNYDRVYSP